MLFMFIVALSAFLLLCKFYVQWTTGRCHSQRKLYGKTVLVTGASKGIGYLTSLDFAKRGARVIITSRKEEDYTRAQKQLILESGNNNIIGKQLDFVSLDNVRAFAADILATEPRLDILVNNAASTGRRNQITKDGLNVSLQVNYFAPFLLTNLLLGLLKKSKPSRIINITSVLANIKLFFDVDNISKVRNYPSFLLELSLYCNSKILLAHATIEMAKRIKESGITVNCLHPGVVRTTIFENTKILGLNLLMKILDPIFLKKLEDSNETTIHLAVCESVEGVTGRYFSDCRQSWLWANLDAKSRSKVWEQSVRLVGLEPHEMYI